MSRMSIAIGLAIAAAVLAGRSLAMASASPEACKPVVKVCGPTEAAPACASVKERVKHVRPVRVRERVEVCKPVKKVERAEVCKPVRKVERVEVCKPVKRVERVEVCKPVKACGPVVNCNAVEAHPRRAVVREHFVLLLETPKRLVNNYRERHAETVYVAPACEGSSSPAHGSPTVAPQSKPPAPLPSKG